MQPATIDPTLDLCIRYPLRLGGPRQCGIRSLPDTSTHSHHWESNPRPCDLEFNALSTAPHAPTRYIKIYNTKIYNTKIYNTKIYKKQCVNAHFICDYARPQKLHQVLRKMNVLPLSYVNIGQECVIKFVSLT